MNPFLDSTDALDDSAELRARAERDGYLYLRGLLPVETIEHLRLQILAIANDAGWVSSEHPLEQAVADLLSFCVEPNPDYMDVYARMYALPDFHAIQHHPSLISVMEAILGDKVLPHPRIIGRTIFPQREAYTTPAHQDFIPIQGTADTYTAWFPLTDLPDEMGGLQIASGSHQKGVYDFEPSLGAGGIAITDPLEESWVTNPFARGDVLVFHSLAVHKGVPNSSDRLRMSMDARYSRIAEPIAPGSLLPHSQPNTWDNIYSDWGDNDLKYYWQEIDLEVKEYDTSYHEKRDALAFEMAERGDETARSALQRVVARDTDPTKIERAEKLLARLDAK
ncbi:MAG: phytanoil-CoA alpha hydroxylase [Gemmatimonadetes bacterium]|nr:phytanoil-CoA alpha hydroxylase [Gemmatimonadota bacterium]|tara:strand:- start:2259 stop:3266 length:1008 start_codon:yes stop_codon:yes gene_type:complete